MAKSPQNNEPPLMIQVCQANRTAFTDLCCIYTPTVEAYFKRFVKCATTIDDLTQEVFSQIWKKREHYRSGTADLAYLHGFAEYVLKNHRKGNHCQFSVLSDHALETIIDEVELSPLDQAEKQEQVHMLQKLIVELPSRQRKALLVLTRIKGLSSQETAQRMGCSEKTVRSYCCRGLEQLKQCLQERA